MMKTLITAFEPFGEDNTNTSLEVMKLLLKTMDGSVIERHVLPVSFRRAPRELKQLKDSISPDMIVMLGQSGNGEEIRIERYAHNLMDSSKADNDGYCPKEEPAHNEAPEAYRTSIDIKSILGECKQQGLPVVISNTAGLYVCNRVYYEALQHNPHSLFIHIPKNFDIQKASRIIQFVISQL